MTASQSDPLIPPNEPVAAAGPIAPQPQPAPLQPEPEEAPIERPMPILLQKRPERKPSGAPDKRRTFRCAVTDGRRAGQIKIGEREFAAVVLDESVGGFGVEVENAPECKIGDLVMLSIDDALVEARIAHITCKGPTESTSQSPQGTTTTRLGLRRLREIEEWELNGEEPPFFSWIRFKQLLRIVAPLLRTYRGAAAMLLGAVLLGFVLYKILEQTAPSGDELHTAKHRVPKVVGAMAGAAGESRDGAAPFRVEPKKAHRKDKADKPQEESKKDDAREKAPEVKPAEQPSSAAPPKVVRLARPDLLLKAEVIKKLSLTSAQQARLRQLFAELRGLKGAGIDTENLQAKIRELGQRGLDVLTHEQQKILEGLEKTLEPDLNATEPQRDEPSDKQDAATEPPAAVEPPPEAAP